MNPSPYQRFTRDNKEKVRSLLINDPNERIFISGGQQIVITPADFYKGEPTFMQIVLKLVSIWGSFDNATKMAY